MSDKTIKQPDLVSCGVACAAMITGTTFEQAKSGMIQHPSGGYNSLEIHNYCLRHGFSIGGCCYRQIQQWDPEEGFCLIMSPKWPLLVGVRSERFHDKDHWIYWCGQHVHDPNPEVDDTKRTLNDYEIIDFAPVLKIERQ